MSQDADKGAFPDQQEKAVDPSDIQIQDVTDDKMQFDEEVSASLEPLAAAEQDENLRSSQVSQAYLLTG